MSGADRKSRAQRYTALTCALMAEVLLGATLLVWSGSAATTPDPALFGQRGWVAVVVVAMVLLIAAMVVVLLAARVSRLLPVVFLGLLTLAMAGVGLLAFVQVATAPGVALQLAFAWVLAVPIALEVRRASAPRLGASDSGQGIR
ncbi:hypothetical protein [Actinokineospora sp.]|uniref:hypothetical protein n=1 Tax=Actinokineospora sp. TaxID=1872133 RepID=UPI0040376317